MRKRMKKMKRIKIKMKFIRPVDFKLYRYGYDRNG